MPDPEKMSDHLQRWRLDREIEALGVLFAAHRAYAQAIAYKLLRNHADAEDAVQDAFLKMLTRRNGFETLETFRSTLRRAIFQCGLDARRSRKRRDSRQQFVRDRSLTKTAEPNRSNAHEELELAIAKLPKEERVLLQLWFKEEQRVSRVARILMLPRTTLNARLAKTLQTLRYELKQADYASLSPLLIPYFNRLFATHAATLDCAAATRADRVACNASTCVSSSKEADFTNATTSSLPHATFKSMSVSLALLLIAICSIELWHDINYVKESFSEIQVRSGKTELLSGRNHLLYNEDSIEKELKMIKPVAVVAGVLLLAPAAFAGPGKDVEEVLEAIREHKAEKEAKKRSVEEKRAENVAEMMRKYFDMKFKIPQQQGQEQLNRTIVIRQGDETMEFVE